MAIWVSPKHTQVANSLACFQWVFSASSVSSCCALGLLSGVSVSKEGWAGEVWGW